MQSPSGGLPEPDFDRIDALMTHHAARNPRDECARLGPEAFDYATCEAVIVEIASHLRRAGIVPGDRVAVLSTPRPEYMLLMMGITRSGAVYVGLNPRHTAAELAHAIGHVRPRLLVALRGATEGRRVLESASAAPGAVPVVWFDSLASCRAGLSGLPRVAPSPPPVDAATAMALSRAAAIVFTSGTTGRPKAAMLTHAGLILAARVQHARLNPARPRYLNNLPINHVGGIMNLTLGALVAGGSVVFQEKFDAAQTLRVLREEGVNCWLQVPMMFQECVRHPDYDPGGLAGLHSICAGGGALSADCVARLRRTGARLFVEYGQTETSSSASYSDDGATDEVLASSIGRFDPRFEFRIASFDGSPCPAGEVGEIQARGRLLFAGYFGDPEATREAFTADGWLRTGDLACTRSDGNVELRGRLKELIKSGGYNVYPREIERVLETHPAVLQAVVHGLPDERFGEAVHALLRVDGQAPDAATLRAFCRHALAGYKIPRAFRVVPAFPLLPNGKVDRIAASALAPGLIPID